MRLWSLHPRYLDPVGIVALWREGLLAQAVLAGRTRGYTRHPQLERFRESPRPHALIASYLGHVADDAARRGYAFDRSRIDAADPGEPRATVTRGQLRHEWAHLKVKLGQRNPALLREIHEIALPDPHPSFDVVAGGVASWERIARPSPTGG